MFPLLKFPKELIALCLSKIDDPQTFFNVVQTCKLVYSLSPIKVKRVEFLRKVQRFVEKAPGIIIMEEYHILPNGKEEGSYITSYMDIPLDKYNYINGKLNGKYFHWDKKGRIISSGEYLNNKENGLQKNWLYSSFGICYQYEEIMYSNDARNGFFRKYIMEKDKSILISEYSYKNDIRDGPFKKWDRLGRLINSGTMKDGIINGNEYLWAYSIHDFGFGYVYFWDISFKNGKEYGISYSYYLDNNDEFILENESLHVDKEFSKEIEYIKT